MLSLISTLSVKETAKRLAAACADDSTLKQDLLTFAAAHCLELPYARFELLKDLIRIVNAAANGADWSQWHWPAIQKEWDALVAEPSNALDVPPGTLRQLPDDYKLG